MTPRGSRMCRAVPRVLAVGVAATIALAGCGIDGGTAQGSDPGTPGSVAVLGDSFASGEGTTGSDADCGRSDAAFAGTLAADLDATLQHLACTGARIADLDDQIGELDGERVAVVVVSVGGNDAGYASVLADCLGVDDVTRALTGDDDRIDLGCSIDGDELEARAEALGPQLIEAYQRVRDELLTSDGRLLVLTYPQLFEDPESWPVEEGERCDGISRTDVALLREAGEALRRVIVAAAAEVPAAEVLDLTEVYEGHGRCGADPWINGLTLRPRLRASFHPTDDGHRATTDALVALLST